MIEVLIVDIWDHLFDIYFVYRKRQAIKMISYVMYVSEHVIYSFGQIIVSYI